MSLPNTFVYMQFHPVAYIVKLNIEMTMANLISKVARVSNSTGTHSSRGQASHSHSAGRSAMHTGSIPFERELKPMPQRASVSFAFQSARDNQEGDTNRFDDGTKRIHFSSPSVDNTPEGGIMKTTTTIITSQAVEGPSGENSSMSGVSVDMDDPSRYHDTRVLQDKFPG